MQKSIRTRRGIAVAVASLLLAVPFLAAAQVPNDTLGRQVVDRIFAHLCARGILKGPRCVSPPPAPATLTLLKSVVNDDGGTATAANFQAMIDGTNVSWGVAYQVSVGSHTASEGTTTPGYMPSGWGGDCAANGVITLGPGDHKACTITNDDIEQAPAMGHLIVDKVTVPSGSGATFTLSASGSGTITGGGAGTTTDAVSKHYEVTAGTYSVTEASLAGWMEMSNTCTNVVVAAGETKQCTIVNHRLPKLTVTKVVMNDDGGTATTTDFALMIDGATVTSGASNIVATGTRMVSEGAHAGYTSTIGGDCAADGSIMLVIGDTKTCTVTNDDNEQAPTMGHLVVDKVTQPSGSTAEFSIMATGSGAITGGGAGTTTDAMNKDYEVAPGTYSVAETAMDGWMIVSNTCVDVVVSPGGTANCTITNMKLPMLTVTKLVVNDNGGTATSSDFMIHVHDMSGTTTVDVAGSPQPGSAMGTTYTVMSGSYHVAETGAPAGYSMAVGGDCAADGSITLAAGDVKTCMITNDDNPPQQGALLMTEVLYDVGAGQGAEGDNEWVEIHNGTNSTMNLSGFTLRDSSGSIDTLPDGTILTPGQLLVVTSSTTTASFYTIPAGAMVVVLSTSIGNGLSNGGDMIELRGLADISVDAVSWGSDTGAFSPSVDGVDSGHSIARSPMTTDTNTAADWADMATPTPGM